MVVDSILFLNEKATFLIGAMNYKSAARLLHEGIAMLEKEHNFESDSDLEEGPSSSSQEGDCRMMNVDATIEGTVSPLEEPQSVVVAVEPSLEFFGSPSSSSSSSCTPNMKDDPSPFSMYRRAMKLVPTAASQNVDLHDLAMYDVNLVSAVLLYNYGLCLHIQGHAMGSENKLEDASLAYEMALGLLSLVTHPPTTPTTDGGSASSTSVFLLELALLNNYGHIHMHFLSTKQVHECLRRMHFILFGATQGWATRIPQEMSCFAHNVLFNASQHIRPAPMA